MRSPSLSDVTVLLPIHRDGNREWLSQAIRSFPRGTKYLVLENDGEVVGALNHGLREADTDFVVAFGADDVALPGFLEHMLGLAWNADVVYPAMVLVSEDLSQNLGLHEASPFCGQRLLQMNYVSGAALFRREKSLEVGGYRDVRMEDWDLWVRIWRAGGRLKPAPGAKFLYRQVRGSRNEQPVDWPLLRSQVVGEEPDPKATFYAQATPATTYVRCQLPARTLPAIVRRDMMAAAHDTVEFPEHRGTAVYQFAAGKMQALTLRHMRNAGIRVLIETDDNYLINPGHRILERQQWGMKIGQREHTRQGHELIVRQADGVIVSTPYLAGQYREINPNVYVCPNSVDPADWWEPKKPNDGIFRIVWFASQSHEDDIPIVAPAFEWASRQRGVEAHVVGLNPNHPKSKFKQRWRFPFGYLPWIDDLDAYRYHFQYFDLGVAPVSRNPMGLGRSDLKMLEYAMGGVFGICQDAPPYEWWRDKPALVAQNSQDFLKYVKWAVANQDEVRSLAQEARQLVLSERTNAAQRHLYEEAVAG